MRWALRRLGMKGAAEFEDGVGHRLNRRARPAERGHDDEFGLAERRQPGLGADRDSPFGLETRGLRANAKAAKNGADQP
jgi:hypothetical protein